MVSLKCHALLLVRIAIGTLVSGCAGSKWLERVFSRSGRYRCRMPLPSYIEHYMGATQCDLDTLVGRLGSPRASSGGAWAAHI